MSGTLFAIAWRNVVRNKRRSLITVLSVAIGLFALLFIWGFNDGSHNNMMANFRALMTGSFQVHQADFFDHPKLETNIADQTVLLAALESAGIDAWTTRLSSFALSAGEETSTGMLLLGLDPVREPLVTTLNQKVSVGRFLEPGDEYTAVIGAKGADKLGLGLGDDIILLTQDRRGTLTADKFEIVGLIKSGDPIIDQALVMVPLESAQELLVMEGRITDLVAQVPESELHEIAAELRLVLEPEDLALLEWEEINPIIRQMVNLDNGFMYIFIGIVVLIVISGVINTVLVSMLQRTREFGVLMAMGTSTGAIGAVVLIEAIFLGILGTAVGTAGGLALVWWFGRTGIDLSAMMDPELVEIMGEFYLDTTIFAEIDTNHLLITVVGLLAATIVSAFYPAWRAMKLEPVEAIRHV
ncbi:MAG: ABC transporter permease [Alphaproteobacteria bacterium]|nr:ABC transporter permease [Alphaproteobacteria bacterium]MBT5860834.1 ABC transporter permease [Alphaproteobacteria bacterium]